MIERPDTSFESRKEISAIRFTFHSNYDGRRQSAHLWELKCEIYRPFSGLSRLQLQFINIHGNRPRCFYKINMLIDNRRHEHQSGGRDRNASVHDKNHH